MGSITGSRRPRGTSSSAGGATRASRRSTPRRRVSPAVQQELEGLAAQLIGEPPRIVQRWSGIFGATEDRLPLAGPIPGREDLWVAAGYSGHGNVLGLACGELVAGAILGRPPPELRLFDPARLL